MSLRRPITVLTLVAALCAAAVPIAHAGTAPSRDANAAQASMFYARLRVLTSSPVADNTVIVRLKGTLTPGKLKDLYRSVDTSAGAVDVVRGDVLSIDVPAGESITDFAEKVEATGEVRYAEPNFMRQPAYTPPAYTEPNDPAYLAGGHMTVTNRGGTEYYDDPRSWWLRDIQAVGPTGTGAWELGYTGPDITGKYPLRASGSAVKVAVIDTGLYTDHPDRGDNMVGAGSDFTPVSPSAVDGAANYDEAVGLTAHGTCVAGQIAAHAGNGIGTLGLANDTVVRVYKVYWGSGIPDTKLIEAIQMAADDGCKVINMSIAGGGYNQALQDAIDYAWSKGCVIVAASGNEGYFSVSYPAAMNHVVAVGALAHDSSGNPKRSYFSNYGTRLDMSAPGSSVWGLTMPGYDNPDDGQPGYAWWDGTSMASPVVAGGIAWLWRAAPWMSNQDVINLVQNTATDMGATGRDNLYGHGALNMRDAYERMIADYGLLGTPVVDVESAANARNAQVSWSPVSGNAVTYDVSLDGVGVVSGTSATSYTLPYETTVGPHTLAVKAHSTKSWSTGLETTTVTVTPTTSVPEMTSLRYYRNTLRWSSTETGRTHLDALTIDGIGRLVVGGTWSTDSLSLGSHAATMTVHDAGGLVSEPIATTFTVRPKPTVLRPVGSDTYGYATKLSSISFTRADTAVIVGGASWMDAMAAAPLAHVVRGPVLVSARKSVPTTVKKELTRLKVKHVIIVGDTNDVSKGVSAYLLGRHISVKRLGATGRYATADAVAREIARRSGGSVPDSKVVVVGDSFTNALAASAIAARHGWPLMYSGTAGMPLATRSTIGALGVTSSLIVGGSGTVPDASFAQLPSPTRISSATKYGLPTLLASWATAAYPSDFSGERVYVASSVMWSNALGLPAASAEKGGVILLTTATLADEVRAYYSANSEVAVTTRVVAGSSRVSNASMTTIKGIVGAP
ncbi:MAG: S8 family serine peptidase [Coriobacteriia bacterium]|nr:S8 family serine peptidase [Coriobacteriia bacterium]